ncbi:fimbria/pilus periplasmic chaperone (plasmid) [Hafnia alvei]|uniref:fimbria/pilus chaperone family protein n=1 Tax=Hafnia alvei TaxID=569 RepID=UPI000B6658A7|nr:fimbria/pilus chaperone family protein [Hafnia alvei]MBI0278586.1 fimbria/pilus periplasmic chaperone [Hafnia alvei]PNL03882.1 fimbrial chaperone protein [Hafnia alvei]
MKFNNVSLLSLTCLVPAILLALSLPAHATGMVPETSVLLVDAAKGQATMNVKNTDAGPLLLYTNVVDVLDEKEPGRLLVTQPVVRVEAGQTQMVRFIYTATNPSQVEKLKRVSFEGIPPKDKNKNVLTVSIRQDLPVIIHPSNLADNPTPWKGLVWTKSGNTITVSNPSKYIVRLSQQVVLLPSNVPGDIGKTYLLPGQVVSVSIKNPEKISTLTQVKIFPATRYGYQSNSDTQPLK